MNNPFDYTPDRECEEAFRKLSAFLQEMKKSDSPDDRNFIRELEAGKMLGVLIAVDTAGERHTLYAFSGQLGSGGFYHRGFVGPVFDYLQPGGYFKMREAEIVRLSADIASFEKEVDEIAADFESAKACRESEVFKFREKCRLSKIERDERRRSGAADEAESLAMIRRSQFEKAELHRLKKKLKEELAPLEAKLDEARERLDAMKRKRRSDSESLQQWLFTNFKLLNARGEERSLNEIFAETPMRISPSGAGECCAPKLLHAARLKDWRPLAIAEYWYGKPKDGEVRIHGMHYPACRGKCLPVLGWMLQGADVEPPLSDDFGGVNDSDPEIIYENDRFCVVDKPAGMLSVPGKGEVLSVQRWLEEKYGPGRFVKMVHRLDQDTSGLLIAVFSPLDYKTMQSLFAMRQVKKTYIADLEGDYRSLGIPQRGHIDLPLSPDCLDRPRQRVDEKDGKEASTDYEFISVSEGYSRIVFNPHTGRTHQLRVHAASQAGLAMPIVGDRLYGVKLRDGRKRLHLHAHRIEFTFPLDGMRYCFESPVPF